MKTEYKKDEKMTQPADRIEVATITLGPTGADYIFHCWQMNFDEANCEDIIHTTELLLLRMREIYQKKFNKLPSLYCNQCGRDVFATKGEYVILKDEVWKQVCDNDYTSPSHILCKDCIERLLGRKLKPEDYYEYEESPKYVENGNDGKV